MAESASLIFAKSSMVSLTSKAQWFIQKFFVPSAFSSSRVILIGFFHESFNLSLRKRSSSKLNKLNDW